MLCLAVDLCLSLPPSLSGTFVGRVAPAGALPRSARQSSSSVNETTVPRILALHCVPAAPWIPIPLPRPK